jgi:hypothetical protein
VWLLRVPLLIPFALMAPEIVAAIQGQPDSIAHLSASTADVLGTSTFLIFVLMLAVTPVHTLTGWRWHIVLRRDYGIAMFATAGLDLFIEALLVSTPLLLLRAPTVRRWWTHSRMRNTHCNLRVAIAALLLAVFAAGYAPLVHELAIKGSAAFVQQPVDD